MQLAVLHYHFRPGGVRRVIEQGLPALVAAAGVSRVIMAGGEEPEAAWRRQLEAALHPCTVEWLIEPALGYWSEQTQPAAAVRGAIRAALQRLISESEVLWAHNLSVGRNMILAQEVAAMQWIGVWLHHHDWWWNGRWERWPEMAAQGIASLEEALEATLPRKENFRHFSVNMADVWRLRSWTGEDVHFVPNPLTLEPCTAAEIEDARSFLRRFTGADKWWLYPCRGLRRKNLAEALLVQRWLAPEAATVTTGGASSAAELHYFTTLTTEAARRGWSLSAGACVAQNSPPVNALLHASDAVVATSLREGFGFAYFEAAVAGRPLYMRVPHELDHTLDHMGVPFAESWDSIRIPCHFYDAAGEDARAAAGRDRLAAFLPVELREPARSFAPRQNGWTDFGCLSLAGQLEVLAAPVAETRSLWGITESEARKPAAAFENNWLPDGWARNFLRALGRPVERVPSHPDWPQSAAKLLTPLLHDWLQHPLLWESAPAQP